jgi:uncharacterized LabA/DUF88 family protein
VEGDIVLDMIESASQLDRIVLFSGLGDFGRVVEAVQRKGARVTIVSTIHTPTVTVARELRHRADRFDDLLDLVPQITREGPPVVEAW